MREIKYTIHFSKTGEGQEFDCPVAAGEAFYRANVFDRPSVIRGNNESAQILARTMIVADVLVKSLPFETDPDFTAAFQRLRAREFDGP